MNFEDLQDIMRSQGITTLASIARALNVSPQSVSNWKARDRVPYKVVLEIQDRFRARDIREPMLVRKENDLPSAKVQIIRDEEIDLRALARVMWTGRRFIALITGTFTLIGVVYSLMQTPYYKSTITLYPASEESSSVGRLQSVASSFGFDVGGLKTNYNIPDVVKSRRIAKTILKKKWITKEHSEPVDLITYWGINVIGEHSLNPISFVKGLFASTDEVENDSSKWIENAIARFNSIISVSKDKKTGLISIDVWMEEPQLAADIANYIAEGVTDYIQAENSFEALRDRTFIDERLTIIKRELNQAENELKEFREKNRRIADSPELQLEEGRLIRQVEVKQQVYITLQQQLEIARIEEVKQTPVIHTLDVAEPAIGKDKPRRKRIVFLSLILGLLISSSGHIIRYQIGSSPSN